MGASMKSGLGEDLAKKLREIGWFVLVALARWLLEYLVRDNPEESDDGLKGK